MIILGIDPGTAITGYGVLQEETTKGQFKALDYGCILTSKDLSPGLRLLKIHEEILKLIKNHKPDALAIENIYFFKNLKTAMPVSQAKGVIIFAAAQSKIPVHEVTPVQVKMTVTGYGRAEKKQVQKMIQNILNLKEFPKQDDAADALGVALCYGLLNQSKITAF